MKNDKEIVGTLKGFDDFVNMVLEDVTEFESTPEGKRVTKLDQILLNGNNITMVSFYAFSTFEIATLFRKTPDIKIISHSFPMIIFSWCLEAKGRKVD